MPSKNRECGATRKGKLKEREILRKSTIQVAKGKGTLPKNQIVKPSKEPNKLLISQIQVMITIEDALKGQPLLSFQSTNSIK